MLSVTGREQKYSDTFLELVPAPYT